MTTVFMGGARSITMIARGHAVVIGDEDGADSCLQRYLTQSTTTRSRCCTAARARAP
jgi:hypothetical protein